MGFLENLCSNWLLKNYFSPGIRKYTYFSCIRKPYSILACNNMFFKIKKYDVENDIFIVSCRVKFIPL
jgi:hypothetical protein